MYLIGLYPIVKGGWTEELQYWSKDPIPPGSIIEAPLRNKQISGLVFKCVPVQEAKGEIKYADFKTKKIESATPIDIVRPEFIQASLKTSTFFVQNIGSLLKAVIPACAFADFEKNKKDKKTDTRPVQQTEKHDKKANIEAISTNTEDRHSTYRSLIREELARKKSILLIAPTTRIADQLYESIKKGIEHVTYLVHSSLSKKKIAEVWTEAIQNERSVVIITTPHFMSIPRHDIETLIVESESSRGYRTFNSPLFDWKKLIENYSKELGARLVYGDTFLSLDTIYRVHNHEIYEIFPLSYRIQQDAEVILIDMVEAKQKTGKYSVLSEELVSMIEYAQKKNQQIFIFASRRGLSPQTICSDCGKTVICKVCKAPVVLHKTNKGERYFLCHHCGKDRSALEACSKCESWNLTTIGIGSDTVYEEVKKLFPETPLFRLDKDNAKGDKEAKKIAKEFSESKGGVLIGTETALSYIEKVKLVAVASMDNLFSIPDFRINERIAHICMRLFEIAESYLLIQSRKTDTEILRAMNSKTLADFVKEELAMREMLSYPPYTLMGKVELSGDLDTITKQAKKIETLLAEQDPLIFPAVIPNKRGSALHLLFTLPKDIWEKETRIHTELYQKLVLISKISPVLINPESFL